MKLYFHDGIYIYGTIFQDLFCYLLKRETLFLYIWIQIEKKKRKEKRAFICEPNLASFLFQAMYFLHDVNFYM